MDILSSALMLFFIMDPVGNLPSFACILKNVPAERRNKVLIRELLIALFVIFVFLFSGQALLDTMHIDSSSVEISGAIILLIIAMRMIFPNHQQESTPLKDEPFIVPLAIPLVAGPSIMAAVIVQSSNYAYNPVKPAIAIFLAWLASSVILMFSAYFTKLLGEKGLLALERLMGMILVMLGVQMFLNGLLHYIDMNI